MTPLDAEVRNELRNQDAESNSANNDQLNVMQVTLTVKYLIMLVIQSQQDVVDDKDHRSPEPVRSGELAHWPRTL